MNLEKPPEPVTFGEVIRSKKLRSKKLRSENKDISIYLPATTKIGVWTGMTARGYDGISESVAKIELDESLLRKTYTEPYKIVKASFFILRSTLGFFKNGNFYLIYPLKDIKITETVVGPTYPTYETTFDFPDTNVSSQTKYGSGKTSRQGYYKRMYPDL